MVVGSRCFFVAKNGKIRLPLSAIHGTLFSNLTDQSQSQCQQLAWIYHTRSSSALRLLFCQEAEDGRSTTFDWARYGKLRPSAKAKGTIWTQWRWLKSQMGEVGFRACLFFSPPFFFPFYFLFILWCIIDSDFIVRSCTFYIRSPHWDLQIEHHLDVFVCSKRYSRMLRLSMCRLVFGRATVLIPVYTLDAFRLYMCRPLLFLSNDDDDMW